MPRIISLDNINVSCRPQKFEKTNFLVNFSLNGNLKLRMQYWHHAKKIIRVVLLGASLAGNPFPTPMFITPWCKSKPRSGLGLSSEHKQNFNIELPFIAQFSGLQNSQSQK
ncbi:unnamed protein product [Blepharisma stoltei]|uniref:Uncharacterized protein n=1 Tax=Blepharisma stoltei TaxID=1481888 RepID=A0AAU9IE72_9CILI|nr:unnamed protein product [Blepharisma stoltei]